MRTIIKKTKIKINVWIFLISYIVLTLVAIFCIKGNEYNDIIGDYQTINIDDYLIGISGYVTDDNRNFKVSGEDPQLLLDLGALTGDNAYGLIVEFDENVDPSDVKFYYGRESVDFSEDDSYTFSGNDRKIMEKVIAESFRYLRIDINTDFNLSNIKAAYNISYQKVRNTSAYLCAAVINIIISIILSLSKKLDEAAKNKLKSFKESFLKIRAKSIAITLLMIIVNIIVSVIAECIYIKEKNIESLGFYRILIFFSIMTIGSFVIKYRKYIVSKAHIFFFLIAMLIGTINIIATPPAAGMSWDDEIHYKKSVYMSWGNIGKVSDADYKVISSYQKKIYERDVYTEAGQKQWIAEINAISEKGVLTEYEVSNIGINCVAYIPAAIGLSFGRGIGLSFVHTFMFGKWINLLVYTVILSSAIKMLKKGGKIIIAVIGLIPTSLFMATEYSYDWWVIGFIILGYAMFISEIQKNTQISTRKFIAIMAVMIVGMLPKAVYFPLIFPMLLLKKTRYKNSKLCRGLVVVSMLLLVGTFIWPVIFNTYGTGDARGGSDVNATEQIRFILEEPVHYAKILVKYLSEYLSLDKSNEYLTLMGYYGQAQFFTLCILIIGIVSIIDNDDSEIMQSRFEKNIVKAGMLLTSVATIALVATALYIDFTPLRNETVLGCQRRYILPVLFPLIYILSRMKINVSEKAKANVFSVSMIVMSYIFLYGIYDLCIAYYY